MQMTFPTDTTIQQAEQLSDKADALLSDTLGNNFRYASYYESAGAKTGTLEVYLLPYSQRAIRAPQLVDQLTTAFAGFDGAKVKVVQKDMAGPPASSFNVQIQTENRVAADKLARDVNTFLNGRELTRSSGIKAKITETWVSDPNTYSRTDNNLYINVGATFDGSDTTTLVTLAKDAVSGEFTADKLKSYGLTPDVLKYDIGQEQENQDSFKTLAMAFPILLFAIYLLLAIQFRSLAQPLLIFMALPFSLFGITLGLYLTDNSFSFFAMLGFFALIGLSIKNTILLTDYANQLRRDGATAVDAAVGALAERFRPLFATSLTAVVSLTPLALASPFWEGLAVVLIFGLLSSTLLVVTVFPYYYLGAEYLRLRVSRKGCLAWLAATAVPSGVLIAHGVTPLIIVIPAVVLPIITMVIKKLRRRSRKA
jgi:multidrug efflux pump subunit AcrB